MPIKLVETPEMADWLRVGPRGVKEALIANRTNDPCELAKKMRDSGQQNAPLYKHLVRACQAKKAGRLEEYLDKHE